MKLVLKNLGFKLTNQQDAKQKLKVIEICNPDGSLRWLVPAKAKKPYFLKFYSTHNTKAKFYAFVMKIIFFFKIQSIVLKSTKLYFENEDLKNEYVDFNDNDWAIFAGTVGPNNKIIYYHSTNKTFTKIATTVQAQKLINSETKILKKIEKLNFETIEVPKVVYSNKHKIAITDISINAERNDSFSQQHIVALSEMYEKTSEKVEKFNIPVFNSAYLALEYLENINDKRIPKNLIIKLKQVLNDLDDKKIAIALAHGDFTPWNCFVKNNKLAVYDWELYNEKIPVGFDAFHFIMQESILVKRKSWSIIKEEILKIESSVFENWTKDSNDHILEYFKYYLLINVSQYLKIYSKQEKWHTQVSWLIETWNESISDLTANNENSRASLITNFFDFIQNKNYAVIKGTDESPALLSEYSDLDITIEKSDLKSIISFFEQHSLTKHIMLTKKSFMATIQIVLNNGSILSLDLIWKFKVKGLEFLSADAVLEEAYTNKYFVKTMSKQHTALYLSCFYGLNNAQVPTKYLNYSKDLFQSPVVNFSTYYSIFLDKDRAHKELQSVVENCNENKGLKAIKNKFDYMIDSLKKMISNKGMIISFSGVDGAGKTTIIEKTKYELEKKLRRKVVVLRHRPSVLPILSTWTKGHQKAQEDVIKSLPRQGTNNNIFSSLLRFSYYFADYFFGQFYILFKHTLRGEIVLYDRYYFDFINDSKRSNIVLPKAFTKFAYYFILTPNLNFFLYADSETILKRKKELDASTITSLNNEYIQLFNDFDKIKKEHFFSIKNIKLEETMEKIMFQAIRKVA